MSSACYSTQRFECFSEEELAIVWEHPLPRHVAIIMDGNRRWMRHQYHGKLGNLLDGHWTGAETLTKIVEAASCLGIKVLTVFGFSTENWGRSPEEIATLLQILQSYLKTNGEKMVQQGVRFHVIGDLAPFPASLKKTIELTCCMTAEGREIDFVVALNYGGRDDMRRAIQKLTEEMAAGRISKDSITEDLISEFLDTAPFGDPDLLIRTSGERRVSNFLLWQIAYTEVYMTETLWPDFSSQDLLKAVLDYQKRQRRRGK